MGLRTHMPPPLPHISPCRAHKPTWPLRRCFVASREKPQMCEFVYGGGGGVSGTGVSEAVM